MPLLGAPLLRYHLAVLRARRRERGGHQHPPPAGRDGAPPPGPSAPARGCRCHVVHEPVIQGTGGGIRGLRDFLASAMTSSSSTGTSSSRWTCAPWSRRTGPRARRPPWCCMPLPAGEKYAAVEMDARRPGAPHRGHGSGRRGAHPLALHRRPRHAPPRLRLHAPRGPRGHQPRRLRADDGGGPHRARRAWCARTGPTWARPARYLATVRDVLSGQRVLWRAWGRPRRSPPRRAGRGTPGSHPDGARSGGAAGDGPGVLRARGCAAGGRGARWAPRCPWAPGRARGRGGAARALRRARGAPRWLPARSWWTSWRGARTGCPRRSTRSPSVRGGSRSG